MKLAQSVQYNPTPGIDLFNLQPDFSVKSNSTLLLLRIGPLSFFLLSLPDASCVHSSRVNYWSDRDRRWCLQDIYLKDYINKVEDFMSIREKISAC